MKLTTRAWLLVSAALGVVATGGTLSARTQFTLYASITDTGGYAVGGLSTTDFVLEVDGKPRPATASGDALSGSFVLLIDRSGSMTTLLEQIALIAEGIVRGLPPGTRAGIAQLTQPIVIRPPALLPDRRDVADAIRGLPIPSATALWDTVDAALTALHGITGYKSIVIISDGDDTFSRTSSTKVLEHAQQMGAVVHGVFLVGHPPGGVTPAGAQFRRFVEDAGGVYWRVRSAKDPATLGDEIAKTLSTRYEITFDQPADGKVHDISLRTTNGRLKVAVATKFKSL